MKEKQGNKPNSYGKLMKRMLIYLGIGGVCGFFVGIFMTFGVKNGMSDLSDLVRPLALPIIAVIFVVSIVLMEFYSRKLKDTMKHLEEAEDEQYEVLSYEEEKYGAMLMNCNVISQVCDIIVLTFTFSRSWLEEASGKELAGFLAACVLFCINFFLYGYYQMRYVKMVQAAHPEKRGDMNSKNFQKDWMASCDEAEKEMVYQSAYKLICAGQDDSDPAVCDDDPASGVPYRYSRSHCRGRHLSDDDTHISSFLCKSAESKTESVIL